MTTDKDARIKELEAAIKLRDESFHEVHNALAENQKLRELCKEMREKLRQWTTYVNKDPSSESLMKKADAILGEGNDEPG